MKKLTSKIICFILIFSIVISNCAFATENTEKYEDLDSSFDYLHALSAFLDTYYLYDIPHEEVINALYEGLINLIHEKSDKKELLDIDKLETQIETLKDIIKKTISDRGTSITDKEISICLYKSLFNVLDRYSEYFTSEEYEKFENLVGGKFVGIGIQMSKLDEHVKVSYIFPDSPAKKSGIMVDDIIVEVNHKNVDGMDLSSLSNLIKGECGTIVNITVKRGDKKYNTNITRDIIQLSSTESKILSNNIGYLKIIEFNANTTEQVEKILATFDKNSVQKIVIDIRDNPGGSLKTVLNILNLFVEKGPLLYVNNSIVGELCYESDLDKQKYEICVLVNENSASASEIFAGAVQDRNAGKIIGTTTYGKGIVQSVYKLINGDAVKFTTAEYFTPNKTKVHEIGITPDIIVESQNEIDLSEFPKFNRKRKAKLNDVGLDVLRAEMILNLLDYSIDEPDGVFDQKTFTALKLFQTSCNLYPYGVLDFSTQDALSMDFDTYINNKKADLQLETAVKELLK